MKAFVDSSHSELLCSECSNLIPRDVPFLLFSIKNKWLYCACKSCALIVGKHLKLMLDEATQELLIRDIANV